MAFNFRMPKTVVLKLCQLPQVELAIEVVDGTNIRTNCSDANNAEWFAYTPTRNYSLTVTSDLAENACKDTKFSVYTGSCQSLVCYASDDDGGDYPCSTNNGTYLSKKTFDVYQGVTYYIALG